ncbi:LysR family transcriptional regulator, partial [Streptomyces sp. NPDC059853]
VTEFDLRVDAAGPHFGDEVLLDVLAGSGDVATLVGARDRYVWPEHQDLRRIPIASPCLAYPVSLILPSTNPHPELRGILAHFASLPRLPEDTWVPSWATRPEHGRGRGDSGEDPAV